MDNRTRNRPACSTAPQLAALPRTAHLAKAVRRKKVKLSRYRPEQAVGNPVGYGP